MNFNTSLFLKSFSIVLGSCVGVTAVASTASAATTSALNPCPKIYYEEPHNSRHIAPPGCPPNAANQLLSQQGQMPAAPLMTQPQTMQSPMPESQQSPIITIVLQAGQVTVRLRNTTNTQVTYQAIGHTQQRTLAAKEVVELQSLPAPATITFLRPDGGFIRVISVATSEPGVLSLMLSEAMGLSDSQTTVRIQSNGDVVAY